MVPRVGDTVFLQHISNPLQHSLSAFDQKLPRRRKVGDTLTVTVEDADGEDVDLTDAGIQWFAGEDEIEDATDAELEVTEDMVGEVISVIVTIDDVEYKAETSEVYDSLALLSADQTGKSVVTLTTNGPVSALDDIDVLKGTKEVEIESIDYEDDGAVVTLKNAIVADAEYTVVLTPADEDDEATSATFTGEKAELERIEFLNNVLVMKDSSYSKGFAYVKGYDQFDDEVTLSGLTVTPGIGQFESYDITTGKITIGSGVAAGETSPFMTVKEVPVFVQYQAGTNIVSAQANLTVSTQAYLASLEFGEIDKDGTKRDDERLTITELSSKKYYIEIIDPQDQYGNTLSADDLNAQKDGDNGNKTLFVIPDNKSGAFYKTGNFGTLNGKTILWLEDIGANTRPGTMALTITGAGGATFTTDVTIEDDPYIDTLNVTYPALYPNVDESDELEFSAVDQYGDPVDLFSFKPENTTNVKTLWFEDENHMANKSTSIQISGNASFNRVTYNSADKTYKVTLSTWGAEKGNIVSFVVNTAGLKVNTASVTVGGEGTAAKIKSSGSSIQLVSLHDETYDFNNKIQFEDANGQVMKRSDVDYPVYSDAVALKLASANGADFKPTSFYWTLAENKLTAAGTPAQTWNSATDTDGNKLSVNGKFNVDDMDGETQDVYVILWGEDGTEAVVLDQKPFHFTRTSGKEVSWTATCSDTLYVKDRDDYEDSVSVKVTAKTDKGETYEIKGSRITLGGIPFETSNNTVYGDYPLDEDGSKVATVYVDGDEKTSVTINYSNDDPKPAKASWKFKTAYNGDRAQSKFGTEVSGDAPSEFDTYSGTGISISGGVMTMTNAADFDDTFTAKIADQYGNDWENTIFKANGVEITDGFKFTSDTGKYVVEYSAEGVTGRFTMYVHSDITASVEKAAVAKSVKTDAQLAAALTNPEIDEIYVDYLANLNGLTISKDVYYRGDGDNVDDAKTMAAVTLNGGDLIFEAEDVTITTLTMTDGDVYVNEGAKLTLGTAVALGDNNIYVNDGILSTATDITTATGKTGAVVLGADAELDATGNINITNLTITEAATTSSPAIVDATGRTITVTKATIAGHGVLADGTIKAATGAEIDITGTSLALAKVTAVLDLTGLAAANIKSINLGTNNGEVIVTTNDALVSLLGNAATNGKISVGGAITLSAGQTIASTKAIEIADAAGNLTGTILCGEGNDLTVSGTASNLVVENSGDLTVAAGATVKEVDNKSTGELTVKGTGTVTTLKAEAGSETTVATGGAVTSLTGTTGGTLNAETGAEIANVKVTAPGTVENIKDSTTGADVNKTAADDAKSVLDKLTITNPTTLTAEQYETASTDDTDGSNVKTDLEVVLEELVIEALGENYTEGTTQLEVTADGFALVTNSNPISATSTATYKVKIVLNGATKTDKDATTLTFTNLPVGKNAAAIAAVEEKITALETALAKDLTNAENLEAAKTALTQAQEAYNELNVDLQDDVTIPKDEEGNDQAAEAFFEACQDKITAAETAIEVNTFLTTYKDLIGLKPAETAYLTDEQMTSLIEALAWFDEEPAATENPELSADAKLDKRITDAKAVLDALEDIMEDQTAEATAIEELEALSVTSGTESTAISTTFTLPTNLTTAVSQESISLEGATYVTNKDKKANNSRTLTVGQSNEVTLDGLTGLTKGTVITVTITTALGNEIPILVTTEAAVQKLYTDAKGTTELKTNLTGEVSDLFPEGESGAEVTLTGTTTTIYSLDQYGVVYKTAPEITDIKGVDDGTNSDGTASLTATVESDGKVTFTLKFTKEGIKVTTDETVSLPFEITPGVTLTITEAVGD